MWQQQWSELADGFMDAAIGNTTWQDVLDRFASATGSRHGQLMALAADPRHQFNHLSCADDALLTAFAATPGHDPAWNTRVRAGLRAPAMTALREADFIATDELPRDPHYRDFAIPCDIPFSCLATLQRDHAGPGSFVGLAVFRGMRDGPMDEGGHRAFQALLPAARAAVRAQLALEGQAAALLAGTLDALEVPALLLDHGGRVQALTGQADALLRSTPTVQLQRGRLYATHPHDARALDQAVLTALHPDPARRTLLQTVTARAADGGVPLILDLLALPARDCAFGFAPRVLVVAGNMRRSERHRARSLSAAYGLTEAEADIAVQLSEAATVEAIAARRCVAAGTVRAQIKALLAKVGVRRQNELVVRIGKHPL